MTYKDEFEKCAKTKVTNWRREEVDDLKVEKISNFALKLTYINSPQIIYDFVNRIMLTIKSANTSDGGHAMTTTLFKELDREVLIAMREKLIELGGTPPALPYDSVDTAVSKPMRGTAPVV